MGVRISWLMFARNWLFNRVASSAFSFASSSSTVRRVTSRSSAARSSSSFPIELGQPPVFIGQQSLVDRAAHLLGNERQRFISAAECSCRSL
ncbi:MAG: hypothetical protein WDO18_02225 [Acidobacteriota bacterium]